VHQSCYRRCLDAVERSKLPSSRVPMDLFGFFKASDSVHCIQYSQNFVASSAMCQGPLDSLYVLRQFFENGQRWAKLDVPAKRNLLRRRRIFQSDHVACLVKFWVRCADFSNHARSMSALGSLFRILRLPFGGLRTKAPARPWRLELHQPLHTLSTIQFAVPMAGNADPHPRSGMDRHTIRTAQGEYRG
jgi:hypothetical protein